MFIPHTLRTTSESVLNLLQLPKQSINIYQFVKMHSHLFFLKKKDFRNNMLNFMNFDGIPAYLFSHSSVS